VSGFAATSFVLLVILLVGAPFLIGMLFGAEFDEASHVLRVHVLSLPFVFLGVSQTTWTAVHDLQKLAMWRTLGGAVINAALNLLLSPSHGAVGAAVATVVAYGFAAIGGNALSSRTRPFLVMQLRQASPLHVARNLKALVGDVRSRLAREPRGRT
jgi:O-antigen/teichoic acid export membrane protein